MGNDDEEEDMLCVHWKLYHIAQNKNKEFIFLSPQIEVAFKQEFYKFYKNEVNHLMVLWMNKLLIIRRYLLFNTEILTDKFS